MSRKSWSMLGCWHAQKRNIVVKHHVCHMLPPFVIYLAWSIRIYEPSNIFSNSDDKVPVVKPYTRTDSIVALKKVLFRLSGRLKLQILSIFPFVLLMPAVLSWFSHMNLVLSVLRWSPICRVVFSMMRMSAMASFKISAIMDESPRWWRLLLCCLNGVCFFF